MSAPACLDGAAAQQKGAPNMVRAGAPFGNEFWECKHGLCRDLTDQMIRTDLTNLLSHAVYQSSV